MRPRARADIVIADTTALMVAIYSGMLFDDGIAVPLRARARSARYDLTLVTGLDLPWVADGLQRDGPQVQEPVDALVREALAQGAASPTAWCTARATSARATRWRRCWRCWASARTSDAASRRWTWACDKCSDPECEHRLFTALRSPER